MSFLGIDGAELAFFLIFLTCFLMVLVTFAIGEIFEIGGDLFGGISDIVSDIPGVDHDVASIDLGGHLDTSTPSPISSRVLFAGLTTFGGIGYIAAASGVPLLGSSLIAVGGFLLGSVGMYLGIVLPISRQQGSVHEMRSRYINLEAQVTNEIPADGQGQVVLVSPISNSRVTEAASSQEGRLIRFGTAVRIVQVTTGGVVVTPLSESANA